MVLVSNTFDVLYIATSFRLSVAASPSRAICVSSTSTNDPEDAVAVDALALVPVSLIALVTEAELYPVWVVGASGIRLAPAAVVPVAAVVLN